MDAMMSTADLYPLVATANTTRVTAVDSIGTAIAASRLIFIRGANAVILAPTDNAALAAAATTLIHFPVDAPILLNPLGVLDQRVRAEIRRLSPQGHDSPARVFLVGPFAEAVEAEIRSLGFTTLRVGSADPVATAVAAADM